MDEGIKIRKYGHICMMPKTETPKGLHWVHVLGIRDVAVVGALALHQYGPNSMPALCHKWIEFVLDS